MSYSTPKTWTHGDTVPAAEMQKYSDGLDAIRSLFVEEKISWAIPQSMMDDTQLHYIVHKRRWLIYRSTGEIRHPTEPETYAAISLSDSETINAVDVDQEVSWLTAGQLYVVVGCSIAFEDEDGIIA